MVHAYANFAGGVIAHKPVIMCGCKDYGMVELLLGIATAEKLPDSIKDSQFSQKHESAFLTTAFWIHIAWQARQDRRLTSTDTFTGIPATFYCSF